MISGDMRPTNVVVVAELVVVSCDSMKERLRETERAVRRQLRVSGCRIRVRAFCFDASVADLCWDTSDFRSIYLCNYKYM